MSVPGANVSSDSVLMLIHAGAFSALRLGGKYDFLQNESLSIGLKPIKRHVRLVSWPTIGGTRVRQFADRSNCPRELHFSAGRPMSCSPVNSLVERLKYRSDVLIIDVWEGNKTSRDLLLKYKDCRSPVEFVVDIFSFFWYYSKGQLRCLEWKEISRS